MSDYRPSGVEKGHPAYDIGIILTRHTSTAKGDPFSCQRVISLRKSIGTDARTRLDAALAAECTCGAGDSISEQTTYKLERKRANDALIEQQRRAAAEA